jgi:heterodisulfide reductase subunit C
MSLTDLTTMAKSDNALRTHLLAKLWQAHPDDCFQCMRCTSGCTSLKLLELKPHEITVLVTSGFIEELVSSDIIWTCAACLKCRERCPQKASPYATIIALRNLAVEREAKTPETYMKAVAQILETGLTQPIQTIVATDMQSHTRMTLGLPELQPPGDQFRATLMEVLGA